MQGKEWLYYLIDSLGKSYRVENGLVVAQSSRKPLHFTPDGWQTISIAWERNLTKWGVNRNFSLPLGFVLDGADILNFLFNTKNFEEKVFLLIQKQNLFISPAEYYFWYKFFYKGELDLSTIEQDENKTTVSIMEGSLSKDLKANENTPYEIPVDELYIKMDGVRLKQRASYIILDDADTLEDHTNPHIVALALLNTEEIQSIGAKSSDRTVANDSNTGGDVFPSKEFNLFTSTDTDITFTWDFGLKFGLVGIGALPSPHYLLQFLGYDKDGNRIIDVNAENYTDDPIIFYNDSFKRFSGSITVSVPKDSEVYIRSTVTTLPSFTTFIYTDDGTASFDYFYLHRTTYIKANTPATHYKRIVGKVTGNESNAVSTLLDSKPNLAVTSGDSIRGFANAVSKTSLNDFFTSFNVVLNAGIGIENNKLAFESKEHFFQNSDIIPLGQVKNVKSRTATDLIYNAFKIGWPNQQYDDVNGRDEFNTTQFRSSPIKRIARILELISVYRGDMFGIEFTRINLDGKTTTDNTADNDTFIINIDYANPQNLPEDTDGIPAGTVYYNLKRETYDSITGIISPSTAFNIEELTPARLLEKHASYLNSILYGFETGQLIYQTSDKNRELKTVKGSVIYDEDAAFDINDSPRIFKTRIFEMEPEASSELVEQLEANPNRCFSFIHPKNGLTYKGFNLKIGIAPNTLQEQAFQLLSTPDNDLTTLK